MSPARACADTDNSRRFLWLAWAAALCLWGGLGVLASQPASAAPADNAEGPSAAPRVIEAEGPPLPVRSGELVTIAGQHFGKRRGRVRIDGQRIRLERGHWSPNLITYQVPDDMGFGYFVVEVQTRAGVAFARPIYIVPPPPQRLAVPLVEQSELAWCWAAVSEMILEHAGVPQSQCNQASWLAARLAPSSTDVDCCAADADSDPCNTAAPTLEIIQENLEVFGQLASQITDGPITFETLAREIDEGRPAVLAYRGERTGHVVLAYGYDLAEGTVWLHDPYFGSFEVPYEETQRYFLHDEELRWSDTILRIW